MGTFALPRPRADLDRAQIYQARYLIAFAVVLASVLELVDTSIVNVAIPHMMGNLGATLDEIAWVSTGYIVANVIVLPMTSWFSDRFGRRNYYTGSIVLFTFASVMCGGSHSLESLVAWRIVQGVGGAALISTAQAILFDVFPREERGVASAIFGVGVMVGPTIGPTLGGWITDNFSWPWIFYINLPLGILAGLLTWRYVPEPSHGIKRSSSVDWAGLALLILGIGSLQIFLERGEARGWFDAREIQIEAALAIIGVAGFVWRELTAEHPIVDLRILKNRQLSIGLVFGLGLGFALYASVFAIPVFLQGTLGYGAWETGRVMLPGALAAAATMAVMGRLGRKLDARIAITGGVGLFLISMILHSHLTTQSGVGDLFWPMILRGIGTGMVFPPLTAAAVAMLPAKDLGQGTGLYNLARQLGGSFGIAIAASIITRFTEQGREALRAHVNYAEPATQARLAGLTQAFHRFGGTIAEAQQKALAVLDRLIRQQASVLAYDRVFLIMGITFTCMLPLLLLFRKGKVSGGPAH
ncbi:MAG TPA: DHA2 family efflux MFS transporter permease subunit [Gemmatimonadales bacterium]|nr:DHA2 family efflux MFS transporter permease subunit [Gemmatimonadales bacterium]